MTNKLIWIADKSEAGWATVDKYLSDEVASGSDDVKKIRTAEQRAFENEEKYTRVAKSGQNLSIFLCSSRRCPFFIIFSCLSGQILWALLYLFLFHNKFIVLLLYHIVVFYE